MKGFVDTNVFIYALEKHPDFGIKSKEILEKVDEEKLEAYTSTLVLKEICWYLESKNKLKEIAEVLERIVKSKLKIVTISQQDLLQAAKLKQKFTKIEFNDLISYVLMKRMGIKLIFTNDEDFDKIPAIKRSF